jgi:hypothetical protein
MRTPQYTVTPQDVQAHTARLCRGHLRLRDHGPTCTATMLLTVLCYAAARITSLAAACKAPVAAPCYQAAHDALLATLPPIRELQRRLNRALQGDLPKTLRRRQPLAIDLHLIPYHGQPLHDADEVYRSKAKPGASANSCVHQPARFKNDVWTCDFIADRTVCGCARVADAGGRIHSGVPGLARWAAGKRGRRANGFGKGGRAAGGTEAHAQRQRLGIHLRGVESVVAQPGSGGGPGSAGEAVGERLHRVVQRSLPGRVPGGRGVRVGAGREGERRVVPA